MSGLTWNEIITLVVSMLALLVSAYAAYQYRKANTHAKEALTNANKALDMQRTSLSLEEAALEMQLQANIASAHDKVQQAVLALSNKAENDVNYHVFEQNYRTAQENWLNAYDQACMSFLEDKINKTTFKKAYHVPIRNIIEEFGASKFFTPQNLSPYQSILKCFDEWETRHR